ncbi:hypothetical protein RI367_001445 [Sorochytrium milnesiophthora]
MSRHLLSALAAVLLLAVAVLAQTTLDDRFSIVTAWTGVSKPTGVRFAPDGRMFVMGKGGIIMSAKNVNDPNLVQIGDITTQVFNNFDRGLTGLAVDPNWPKVPYVYVLYGRDGRVNGSVPLWNSICTSGICEGSGAVGRLTYDFALNKLSDYRDIMIQWCTASTSHQVGDLHFDNSGNLIMTGGDHSFFSNAINFGENPNPCPFADPNDPESGGSMQAQSPGNPTGKAVYIKYSDLDKFNKDGTPPPYNIAAFGLRNPYRSTVDRATNEIYIADVGFATWEELNYMPPISQLTKPRNYGWPCLEGPMVTATVQNRNFKRCNRLYQGPDYQDAPLFQYNHWASFGNVPTKPDGQSAITGVAMYRGSTFGDEFAGSAWIADYTRYAVWVMKRNATGIDTSQQYMIVQGARQIVDLTEGPDGALYLSSIWDGRILRLQAKAHMNPVAVVSSDVNNGPLPLTVNFDGTASVDPLNTGALAYAWDLDGSGQFAGGNGAKVSFQYTKKGKVNVSLRVTAKNGATGVTQYTVYPGYYINGNIAVTPNTGISVGDTVNFGGRFTTDSGAAVAASQFQWTVLISHCYPGPVCRPNDIACHQHLVNVFANIASGTIVAPDHEFPSHLTFTLDIQHPDMPGLVQHFTADAQNANLQVQVTTNPPGLNVNLNLDTCKAPCQLGALRLGNLTLDTPMQQMDASRNAYIFQGWSQGGPERQIVTLGQNGAVYTARFAPSTIGKYPAGQGPAAPIDITVLGAFRLCTVNWRPPTVQDPANPIVGYIIYYREVKFGLAQQSPFYTSFAPASAFSWDLKNVDLGSRCEFQVSAVTKVGESSFKSDVYAALAQLNPPLGITDCPPAGCVYRGALIDDFNHQYSSKNLLNWWQESDQTFPLNVANGKLVYREDPKRAGTGYWYSGLTGDNLPCVDGTQFTHLTFKVSAPPGADFSVAIDSRGADCKQPVQRNYVKISKYAKMDGTEKTLQVPMADLGTDMRGISSISFNGFTSTAAPYLFDDLALLNLCNNPPAPPSGGGGSHVCSVQQMVDDFAQPDRFNLQNVNEMGFASGDDGSMAKPSAVSNNQLTMIPNKQGTSYFYSSFAAPKTCYDASRFTHLNFTILNAPANSDMKVTIVGLDNTCTNKVFSTAVSAKQYALNDGSGITSIPLSAFGAAITLSQLNAVTLTGFAPADGTVAYSIGNIALVNIKSCQNGGAICQNLLVDDFAAAAAEKNKLGLWSGSQGMTSVYGKGSLKLTANKPGAYYSTVLAGANCRDISKHKYVQFDVAGAAGTTFNVELQVRAANCQGGAAARHAVSLDKYVKLDGSTKTVQIPVADFAGVDLTKAHALSIVNLATKATVTLDNLQLVCDGAAALKKGGPAQ